VTDSEVNMYVGRRFSIGVTDPFVIILLNTQCGIEKPLLMYRKGCILWTHSSATENCAGISTVSLIDDRLLGFVGPDPPPLLMSIKLPKV